MLFGCYCLLCIYILALPKTIQKMKKIVTSVVALLVMGSVAFAQETKTEKKETKKTTKTAKESKDGKKDMKKSETKTETKTETKKK